MNDMTEPVDAAIGWLDLTINMEWDDPDTIIWWYHQMMEVQRVAKQAVETLAESIVEAEDKPSVSKSYEDEDGSLLVVKSHRTTSAKWDNDEIIRTLAHMALEPDLPISVPFYDPRTGEVGVEKLSDLDPSVRVSALMQVAYSYPPSRQPSKTGLRKLGMNPEDYADISKAEYKPNISWISAEGRTAAQLAQRANNQFKEINQ